MAEDSRTYIRVHDGMPDHPKIDALSDRAFRLLMNTWCWCSRHLTDGAVPRAYWSRRSTPSARRELLAAGLIIDPGSGDLRVHDYLQHQRSKAEVEEVTAARRTSALKANHTRWHTGPKGKRDPECTFCIGSAPDPTTESERTTVGIHIGIGTGIDTVDPVETLGGGVPDLDAQARPPAPNLDPNNPRCPRHRDVPADDPGPPCRACRDIRLELEQQNAPATQRRDLEARHCRWCDIDGWRIDPERRYNGPLAPGVRCDHTPMHAAAAS